jgi:hypothetical protein
VTSKYINGNHLAYASGSISVVQDILIVRLKYVIQFGHSESKDVTYVYALPAIWSAVEICTATICACLPAFRGLFKRPAPPNSYVQSSSGPAYVRQQSQQGKIKSRTRTSVAALDDGPMSPFGDEAAITKVWAREEEGYEMDHDLESSRPTSSIGR